MAALNGTEYFIASLIAIFTIERFGRRKLMLFGAVGQSISMAVLAGTTSVKNSSQYGVAAAVFLFVFNSFFAGKGKDVTYRYLLSFADHEMLHSGLVGYDLALPG